MHMRAPHMITPHMIKMYVVHGSPIPRMACMLDCNSIAIPSSHEMLNLKCDFACNDKATDWHISENNWNYTQSD